MRSTLLYLVLCSIVLVPIQGSRLGKLEEVVKSLRSFVYSELSSIRHEVKEISNRVDMLENTTVTQDPSSSYQDTDITYNNLVDKTGESGKQLLRAGNNEASHVVTAEVQNMHRAYSNDKQDLHQLKQDVKEQLRELQQKITSHMHNLTADVQHNIEYIHENISLANVTLSEFINGLVVNTSQQLTLQFDESEANIKQNIYTTSHQNENKIERFIALADRNVSQMILKADNLVNIVRSNFSAVPTQITYLSLEVQTTRKEIKGVEERLEKFESTSNKLEEEIYYLKNLQYGYFYSNAKDIRLANVSKYGSTGFQGRLEVRYDNKWGTVCDDGFSDGATYITNNLIVVCRMFGFRKCDYVREAGMGEGSGDIWMDDVECRGSESSVLECPHDGWGVHDCKHREDIGFRMWN